MAQEILRSRTSTEYFVKLAKKLSTYSGKKVAPALLMKILNQAAWEVQAPPYNCGKKDSTDALNGFVLKLRKDLNDLDLNRIFSIGDGRGKGYTIFVDADAVAHYLDGTDTDSYLAELRKPGPRKKPTKLKKTPQPVQKKDEKKTKEEIPVHVPPVSLNIKGKIDLDSINQQTRPSKKTREEKRNERVSKNTIDKISREGRPIKRSMEEFRGLFGMAAIIELFIEQSKHNEVRLSSLYPILRYNDYYHYPVLMQSDNSEKGIADLRRLIDAAFEDTFIIRRDEMNNLVVAFKRSNRWSEVKAFYSGRILRAQFAVRQDIGYTWKEEFLQKWVKEIIYVDGKPSLVTLQWNLCIQQFQAAVLDVADALDGSALVNYRMNNQEVVTDREKCNKLLSWIFKIDAETRENGLLKNAVEIDEILGVDIITKLLSSPTNNSAINNRLFYLAEKL